MLDHLVHWVDTRIASTSPLNQLLQMTPQSPAILNNVPSFLVVLAIKTLVALRGVSSHLSWPLKIWLVLNFFLKPDARVLGIQY